MGEDVKTGFLGSFAGFPDFLDFIPGPSMADIGHDWEWVNPLPQGQALEDFSVVDSQTIYAPAPAAWCCEAMTAA